MLIALSARLSAAAIWAACFAAPLGVVAVAATATLSAPPAAASARDLTVTLHSAGQPDGMTVIPLQELAAMPQTSVRATTPWTEGVVEFEGVAFADIADRLGVEDGSATLTALNAYQVTVDVRKVIDSGGVLALKMNGKTMSVRDKGPIWLVFPSVDRPELVAHDNSHMWIWQINEIDFGPR